MVKENPENSVYSVVYPANFESLAAVRQFVVHLAEECGLKESAVNAVELAVDEAFTNIVEHAYGGECQEEIECTCRLEQQGITITLRDCGQPFSPEGVPAPDLDADLEDRQVGGLGLYFMRQLMDEVNFTFVKGAPGQRGGNILTMTKRKERST